jgi:hypothetical protein
LPGAEPSHRPGVRRYLRGSRLSPKLHPAMWLRNLDETDFSVELVGVLGAEQQKSYVTNVGMIDRCLDDELSESLTSERIIDKHIAEPPEGGSIGHPPGEANLLA